jgi:hypothetical protein
MNIFYYLDYLFFKAVASYILACMDYQILDHEFFLFSIRFLWIMDHVY